MATKIVNRRVRLSYIQTFESSGGAVVTNPTTTHVWTDSRTGVSMRNYKERIARGLQATTSFYGEMSSVDCEPGSVVLEYGLSNAPSGWRYREQTGHILHGIAMPTLPHSSEIGTATTKAQESFYSKYRKAQTAFQGGVALGEVRESIRMLRSPARALRRKVGDLYDKMLKNKHRAGKTAASQNRYLSQTWLEGSFGWKPLINDVAAAHEAIHKRRNWIDRKFTVISGVGIEDNFTTIPDDVSFGSGGLSYRVSTKTHTRTMVRYLGAVRCKEVTPYTSASRYWGFSPDNIVPTVWELIPYSFLIDYFTNIGKVIDAASLRQCTLAWGVRTERRTSIRTAVDARNTADTSAYLYTTQNSFNPGSWTGQIKTIQRVPVDTVPIPDFRFKLPNSSTQWVNIGALLRVRFNNPFRR